MVFNMLVKALVPSLALGAALTRRETFDLDALSLRTVGARNTLVSPRPLLLQT